MGIKQVNTVRINATHARFHRTKFLLQGRRSFFLRDYEARMINSVACFPDVDVGGADTRL